MATVEGRVAAISLYRTLLRAAQLIPQENKKMFAQDRIREGFRCVRSYKGLVGMRPCARTRACRSHLQTWTCSGRDEGWALLIVYPQEGGPGVCGLA
mmetsp:Transcript_28272/g.71619  ORF Transcript_28272/g.71619 Transcript_28272/m.71619 type:complete len:97 (+) Transcript_28272:196-486(+)